MSFLSGDRVVCVNDCMDTSFKGLPQSYFRFPNGFVIKGNIYNVDEAFVDPSGEPCVRITGYPVFRGQKLGGWNGYRFRLVWRDSEDSEITAVIPCEDPKEAALTT